MTLFFVFCFLIYLFLAVSGLSCDMTRGVFFVGLFVAAHGLSSCGAWA